MHVSDYTRIKAPLSKQGEQETKKDNLSTGFMCVCVHRFYMCVRARSSACMYEYPRVGVLTGCKVWMCSCMFMCVCVAGRACIYVWEHQIKTSDNGYAGHQANAFTVASLSHILSLNSAHAYPTATRSSNDK